MTRSILYSGKSNEFSKWHEAQCTHRVSECIRSSVALSLGSFQIEPWFWLLASTQTALLCMGWVLPVAHRASGLVLIYSLSRGCFEVWTIRLQHAANFFPHESSASLSIATRQPLHPEACIYHRQSAFRKISSFTYILEIIFILFLSKIKSCTADIILFLGLKKKRAEG